MKVVFLLLAVMTFHTMTYEATTKQWRSATYSTKTRRNCTGEVRLIKIIT
jgi:hypothetical protein